MYESSIAPLLCRFIEGESINVLTYGPRCAGKAYALGIGPELRWESDGMLHQCIHSFFDKLKNVKTYATTEVFASFLSINQGCTQDLFHCNLNSEPNGQGTLKDEWQQRVHTVEDLTLLLKQTAKSKQMDYFSSSHLLFSILLKQKQISSKNQTTSRICFVYLVDPKSSNKARLQPGALSVLCPRSIQQSMICCFLPSTLLLI
ncbi:P-loop containing nucleoside triphosphate hydrolase protein [Sporodiniella umbellata]|nr:P-loop containing nucleoside triphosphate hydrolase protein [Sporodiniella umbellata]